MSSARGTLAFFIKTFLERMRCRCWLAVNGLDFPCVLSHLKRWTTGTAHLLINEKLEGKSLAGVGELAQMVERSLSMREVAGSTPAFSRFCYADLWILGGTLTAPDPVK